MQPIDFNKKVCGVDGEGYRDTIATALFDLLTKYSACYPKMMVVRFDLRYPKGHPCSPKNVDISDFMQSITQKYCRQKLSLRYFWVREHGLRSQNHHYHCMILLDANKTCRYYQYLLAAEEIWGRVLEVENTKGLVHHCTKDYAGEKQENGIILRSDDPRFEDKIDSVIRIALYMSKEYSKGLYNDGVRDFGMSRLSSISTLRKRYKTNAKE